MFSFLRREAAPRPARAQTRAQTRAPTVAEIAEAVAGDRMWLLDVREAAELRASGKAKGAVHIPLGLLGLKADPKAPDALIAPGRPVAVYCASGGRSGMAAQQLARMGYGPVWNLGGLGDWTRAGGAVEKG